MPPIGYGTCCRPGAKGEEACLIVLVNAREVKSVNATRAFKGWLMDTP